MLEPIELFIENVCLSSDSPHPRPLPLHRSHPATRPLQGNSEVLCDLAEWILSYQEILCPKAAPDPEEAPIDPTQASPRVKPQERMATNKVLSTRRLVHLHIPPFNTDLPNPCSPSATDVH